MSQQEGIPHRKPKHRKRTQILGCQKWVNEGMNEWRSKTTVHCTPLPFKTIYLILPFGNLTFFNRKKISLACMHILSVYLLLLYHYHCHHHYFRGYYRDLLPCGVFSRNCISLLGFRFCSVPVIPPTSVQFSQTTMDLFPLTAHCWGHSVNTGAWKFRNITSSWFLLAWFIFSFTFNSQCFYEKL